MRKRHIPQRTCVACRRTGEKASFVRVVRRPDGSVLVDETGKLSGRGAYLCDSMACASDPKRWQKVGRSLSVRIGAEAAAVLDAVLQRRDEDAATEVT